MSYPHQLLRSCLLFCLLLSFACREAPDYKGKTGDPFSNARITGTIAAEAMVVSAHPLASKAGIDVMQRGGNAIDAAIAVQFALAVTYPIAGNIGGGGFMVYRTAEGEVHTLDFRETAPQAAHRDMYLDPETKEVIPRLSLDGHLAAGVPGTVAGMEAMHKKFGSMEWGKLLESAIDIADQGLPFYSEKQIEDINDKQDGFRDFNTTGRDYFYREGGWKQTDTLFQKDLAATLKAIQANGRDGFYKGWVADSIVMEMKRGQGIINHEDLANYQAKWRAPIKGSYKDYTIWSMSPPSSGGIALLQILKTLEKYPMKKWGFHSPQAVHHMVEAERRAYADRATHLGDPDFYQVPIAGLLEDAYLAERAKSIHPKRSSRTTDIEAGAPAGAVKKAGKAKIEVKESEQTTHFSIVDEAGNAVSITTTLNAAYGSKVAVGGAGFLLNNEMDDFSSKPGVPNLYGLVGNEANAIAANKRMLSSMTPTIIEKDNGLFMVVGTPGGSTIITSVAQCFLNVAEYGMSMQEAVNAKRFHHQWKPDSVYIEKGALVGSKAQLSEQGHNITERRPIGRVDAILVRPDGTLEGGADIRGYDAALGY